MSGIVVAAGLAATAFTTAPAHASVGCRGTGCQGKYPGDMGCQADAYVPWTSSQGTASITVSGNTLRLFYSPACNANWAELSSGFGWSFHVYNANGAQGDGTLWFSAPADSKMVDGTPRAWACFDNGACTNRY